MMWVSFSWFSGGIEVMSARISCNFFVISFHFDVKIVMEWVR